MPKGNYWILSLDYWRAVKKYQNFTFKVNFLCQKSSESFWIFFHWRISIKEHICCYWHFLIKSIFNAVYYWNDAQFLTARHYSHQGLRTPNECITQRKLWNFENWVNGEVSKIGHHFSKESDLKIDANKKCQ